jgi:hypothetical protein
VVTVFASRPEDLGFESLRVGRVVRNLYIAVLLLISSFAFVVERIEVS